MNGPAGSATIARPGDADDPKPGGHMIEHLDQGERACEAAVDRGQFVFGDQAVGLGARDRGVALHVGENEVELGAAERFDASALVDHLDREFGRGDAADADLCHASGGRVQSADIDWLGGPAAQRHCAERTRGEDATRPQQKLAAALPLR